MNKDLEPAYYATIGLQLGETTLIEGAFGLLSKSELETLLKQVKYNLAFVRNPRNVARYNEQRKRVFTGIAKPETPKKPTYVYVMHNGNTGYYKIGRSTNPIFRERTLQSQEPDIELLFAYPGTKQDEAILHNQFAKNRVRGEWFYLNEADLSAIEKYLTL